MFAIPETFVRKQREIHGAAGPAWLDQLPGILDATARRWGLTIGPPFPNLSYHYVAPATRADGMPVVVKACSPTGECPTEAAALRLYDGRGAARLLAADAEREVLLLERLLPGTPLAAVADDAEATAVAVGVMRALWRPVPPAHPFPAVADWGRWFEQLRAHFGGGTGPLPAALVAEAERLFGELVATAAPPVVLHGDLNHANILHAGPRGWLAIDPKGLIGEPACEAGGAILWNHLPGPPAGAAARRALARRIAQLAEALGAARERVWAWGLVQGVLAAWWPGKARVSTWAVAHAERLAAIRE
ncbi:MAG TPA: aminoglycoside phosphotransferase family protein [Thermomicrobiales bacterium]|nr:aminoglycoside phosphotransferase family protein [Thermomicrobiales bacterium]